ncbi:isochorismatase family protein [Bradyrhizobium sp. WSM3983]|uniref:isochorismatase family protein n=1 Tax=Bradyrhizobium sp. WSM3983 TaxID=1038867 RepID=UPI000563C9EC|nr:isochorismatase family protein [Bradyrhizobium sp. WSM3983]
MSVVRQAHELEDYRARGFANKMGFGKKPALVVIDLTNGFTDPRLPLGAPAEETISQVNILVDAAHEADVPVFFSTISYDGPGMSDAGVWLLKMQGLATLRAKTAAVEIDQRLHRANYDTVLEKRYASCFFGTEFASRLWSQGVDTLIIAGCTTSGCVRATAVDACQSGLRTIVVRDAVSDRSKSAHNQSLIDIEAKYGDIVTVRDVIAHLCERQGSQRATEPQVAK